MSTSSSSFTVEAPGRLCLFGEHQDYLHMPVIAAALPLTCKIVVERTPHRPVLVLQVPQLQQRFEYDLTALPPRQGPALAPNESPDFALAAIYEALDDGWTFADGGAVCVSTTDIPFQAGCSSSSAFCVAWSLVLAQLATPPSSDATTTTCNNPPNAPALLDNPILLAQRAHRAEVTHFGAPGGTMDHVTSAVGGLLRIGPGPWEVTPLHFMPNTSWVLAYSGQPKDTWGHLHRCKDARLALLEKLNHDWDTGTQEIIQDKLSTDERILLSATLVNRDTERQAAALWQKSSTNEDGTAQSKETVNEQLGQLMQRHHEALRDGLQLSTNVLETLGQTARDSGAFGFKVVGSGGGGCGVAWTSSQNALAVAKAMEAAGAPQVWVIEAPSQGARLILSEK